MMDMLEALWELKEVMEEWNNISLAANWDGDLRMLDDDMNDWFKKATDALEELERAIRKDE